MQLPARVRDVLIEPRSDGTMQVYIQYADEAMEPGLSPNRVATMALARWMEGVVKGALSEQTQTDSI